MDWNSDLSMAFSAVHCNAGTNSLWNVGISHLNARMLEIVLETQKLCFMNWENIILFSDSESLKPEELHTNLTQNAPSRAIVNTAAYKFRLGMGNIKAPDSSCPVHAAYSSIVQRKKCVGIFFIQFRILITCGRNTTSTFLKELV
jgi:hypothetical protein